MHSYLVDAVWVLARALNAWNSCMMLGNSTNTSSSSTRPCDLVQEVATTKWKDKKVCTGSAVMEEAIGFIVLINQICQLYHCNDYQEGEYQLFDGNGNLAQQSATVVKQYRGYRQCHTPHGCYTNSRQ